MICLWNQTNNDVISVISLTQRLWYNIADYHIILVFTTRAQDVNWMTHKTLRDVLDIVTFCIRSVYVVSPEGTFKLIFNENKFSISSNIWCIKSANLLDILFGNGLIFYIFINIFLYNKFAILFRILLYWRKNSFPYQECTKENLN